jgi:hypothetical protein
MDQTSVFAPITKTAPQEDGSLLVYGKATDSSLDLDEQVCDAEWLKKAMPKWFGVGGGPGGNIREQHDGRRAVGRATEYEVKDGGHFITAKIIDPLAKAKLEAGVLTGFSIGIKRPRIVKDASAMGGRITDGMITEVSIVDRSCNESCRLDLVKAAASGWEGSPADFDEDRGLVKCEELTLDPVSDVSVMTVKLGDAVPAEKARQLEAAFQEPTVRKTVEPDDAPAVETKAVEPEFDAAGVRQLADDVVNKGVDAALSKAADGGADDMPPQYDEEQGDAQNAMAAIAIISRLIVSEAQEMVNNPAEDCDISILLQAVASLRCFANREQKQSMGENGHPCPPEAGTEVIVMAADADVEKAKYSAQQKRQMMKKGQAIPNAKGDPSFPIADGEDLKNAISDVGRGGVSDQKIRKHIIAAAKRLGLSSKIPDDWTSSGSSSGSSKSVEPEMEKTTVDDANGVEETGAADPEATKAAVVEEPEDGSALVKALTAALEKADDPLRKLFVGIVEASTETTAKSLTDLGERLVKVEAMATPGGPALRRTEIEHAKSRKDDLIREVARFKALAAANSDDHNLRKGYHAKAMQLETQIKAL